MHAYDANGNTTSKTDSTATTTYSWDFENRLANEETNGAGAVIALYVQTRNVDEQLAIQRSGVTSYYEADGLGSLTSLSSASGALANTYTYERVGNLVASSGSIVNNFRYTGREFDTAHCGTVRHPETTNSTQ